MKKIILFLINILFINVLPSNSQSAPDTTFYLITCAPGTETYSVWGHSALRVVIRETNYDMVYNWGVFDFNTPHFAWKFAKGRLNYMLGVYPYDRFLQDYFLSQRAVWSQEINLEPVEKLRLMLLLEENMKPENRYYRYDFFYDDCSTRIRDMLEKILGSKLIYPPDETTGAVSFRSKIGEYTGKYPWLKMGIDLLMGTPGEKRVSYRDEMFLPYDLQRNLSGAVINRDRKMVPLLASSEVVLDFPEPDPKRTFFASPSFIFSMIFVIVLVLSVLLRKSPFLNYLDILIFLVFALLSLMMIFFNFFTDHDQMKANLNIIWLNPVIPICLGHIIFGKEGKIWFRIVFAASAVFVPLVLIMPQALSGSFLPLLLIILLRSSVRSSFSWNPLTV